MLMQLWTSEFSFPKIFFYMLRFWKYFVIEHNFYIFQLFLGSKLSDFVQWWLTVQNYNVYLLTSIQQNAIEQKMTQ